MKDIIKYLVSLSTIIFLVSDFSSINAKAEELSFLDNNPGLKAKLLIWQTEAPADVKRKINILRKSSDAIRKAETVIELGKVSQNIKGAILVLIETFNDISQLEWVQKSWVKKSGWRTTRFISPAYTSPAEQAGKVLAKIGEPAVEPLIEALKDKGMYVREGAAKALGQIGDDRAFKPLMRALVDKSYGVRKYSVESLQKIRPRWSITIEAREAVWYFIEALKDEDEGVRRDAVKVLGLIGDDRAVEPLIKTLEEKDEWAYVLEAAATALGRIGDDRAVEVLIKTLEEKRGMVRAMIAVALEKITGEDFDEDYYKWKAWWESPDRDNYYPANTAR